MEAKANCNFHYSQLVFSSIIHRFCRLRRSTWDCNGTCIYPKEHLQKNTERDW